VRILRLQGYHPHAAAWDRRIAGLLAADPSLRDRPWREQQDALAALGHPAVDGFAAALRARGHEAEDLLFRLPHVRAAFLRDHDLPPTLADDDAAFAVAAVRAIDPEVVIERDVGLLRAAGVGAVRRAAPGVRRVLVHHAVPDVGPVVAEVDAALVVCPAYRPLYEAAGARRVEVLNNAFYAPALAHVAPAPRDVPVSFVGRSGFGGAGKWSRFEHLAELMARTPLECWLGDEDKPMLLGMSRAGLRARVAEAVRPLRGRAGRRGSTDGDPVEAGDAHPERRPPAGWRPPLRPLSHRYPDRIHPGVFGVDMLTVLGRSLIAFNRGPDREGDCAGTFRIFEATAMGAVLLTEATSDLADHFEPGAEVVTYRDVDDCVRAIDRLLDDPARLASIAAAGRRRTLTDHTWDARAAQLEAVLADL